MIFNIHIYVHFNHSGTKGHKNMQMLKTITLDTCIDIEIQFQRNFSIRIFFSIIPNFVFSLPLFTIYFGDTCFRCVFD